MDLSKRRYATGCRDGTIPGTSTHFPSPSPSLTLLTVLPLLSVAQYSQLSPSTHSFYVCSIPTYPNIPRIEAVSDIPHRLFEPSPNLPAINFRGAQSTSRHLPHYSPSPCLTLLLDHLPRPSRPILRMTMGDRHLNNLWRSSKASHRSTGQTL